MSIQTHNQRVIRVYTRVPAEFGHSPKERERFWCNSRVPVKQKFEFGISSHGPKGEVLLQLGCPPDQARQNLCCNSGTQIPARKNFEFGISPDGPNGEIGLQFGCPPEQPAGQDLLVLPSTRFGVNSGIHPMVGLGCISGDHPSNQQQAILHFG
jgi:hypothetical protein